MGKFEAQGAEMGRHKMGEEKDKNGTFLDKLPIFLSSPIFRPVFSAGLGQVQQNPTGCPRLSS